MTPRDEMLQDRALLDRAETLLTRLREIGPSSAGESLCAQIVDLTLPLADSAARGYRYRGIDIDDLTQVARLGLMKAIRGYDPSWGCGFAAYAMPTITGEIKRHFRDHGWVVRPPRPLQELRARLAAEEETLRARLGREPAIVELAEHLGVTPAAIAETRQAARGYCAESLSSGPDGQPAIDPAAPGDPYREVTDWESIRQALHTLTPRQRRILRLRFVEDLTQAQIAEQVGVSQMQISRILSRCMSQLQDHVETEPRPRPRPSRMPQAVGTPHRVSAPRRSPR